MKILTWSETITAAVKQVGKFAVYVNNGLEFDSPEDEAIWQFVKNGIKDIFGDETEEYFKVMQNLGSSALFFFDTEQEQERFYCIFEKELTDSSAIYACTYNKNGECQTENT